jgi:hypothetical protein
MISALIPAFAMFAAFANLSSLANRLTLAYIPTSLSLMKLTITIGHDGCEGMVS